MVFRLFCKKCYPPFPAADILRLVNEDGQWLIVVGCCFQPKLIDGLKIVSFKPDQAWIVQIDMADVVILATGTGDVAIEFAKRTNAGEIVGLDPSQGMLAVGHEKLESRGLQDRVRLVDGDALALPFDDGSFDAVISLDTLYWASDLEATLSALARTLKPGGRMGIFMNHHIKEGDPKEFLAAPHSALAKAAANLDLSLETFGYTKEVGEFWRRNLATATDLKQEFEAEGNGFIAESLIRESKEDYLPDVNAGLIARYLYLIRC